MINKANPSPSLAARERAFATFAATAGFKARIARAGHSDYDGGREAARRLLAIGPAPDAIFCVNELMAFGALDHLRGAVCAFPMTSR